MRNKSLLTTRIISKYVLTLAGSISAYVVLVYICWRIASSIIWQPDNVVYGFLSNVQDNLLLISGVIIFLIFAAVTYYYMSKLARYLDEVVHASERLVNKKDIPIILSEDLKNVQDELNSLREQAARNEMLAKESEQRKNDLVVYLAHDLKTPLTTVIGYLTLLNDEPQIPTELRAKYVGIAFEKALRLEALIDEFFDITRFNLTSLTLDTERTNLSRMLEQITSEFIPVLAEKDLAWNTIIESGVEILCDPDKLVRVFDNLIRNAVNYSYSGTKISLGMRKNGDEIEIVIKNRGRTIPPEKLEHIFEQFFRVDSARSSSTGGAGLGLAIAKEIIELHGGTIEAESENESIIFTVLLPSDRKKIV